MLVEPPEPKPRVSQAVKLELLVELGLAPQDTVRTLPDPEKGRQDLDAAEQRKARELELGLSS